MFYNVLFTDAVSKNDMRQVEDLLRQYPLLSTSTTINGWPMMHHAAIHGKITMFFNAFADAVSDNDTSQVEQLLREYPLLGTRAMKNGWPMTHYAAIHGQTEMLRVLARNNVSIDMPHYALTPLDMAIYNNNVDSARELIRMGAQVDESSEKSAVYYAMYKDCMEMIRTTWSKTAHESLVGICISLAPLALPAYVLLWIIDWLQEYTFKPEIRKIRLIEAVTESIRRIEKHKT